MQKLPSSWPAQSAVTLQPHWFAPLTHAPALQTSPTVQPLPSSQLVLLLVCVQPETVLQPSVVHGLLSLHAVTGLMFVPAQLPAPQTSFAVHALLSLQGSVLAV